MTAADATRSGGGPCDDALNDAQAQAEVCEMANVRMTSRQMAARPRLGVEIDSALEIDSVVEIGMTTSVESNWQEKGCARLETTAQGQKCEQRAKRLLLAQRIRGR